MISLPGITLITGIYCIDQCYFFTDSSDQSHNHLHISRQKTASDTDVIYHWPGALFSSRQHVEVIHHRSNTCLGVPLIFTTLWAVWVWILGGNRWNSQLSELTSPVWTHHFFHAVSKPNYFLFLFCVSLICFFFPDEETHYSQPSSVSQKACYLYF